ncbi:MAG: sterol transporter outer membrane protein BstC [Methylomonas sp.]
MSIRRLLPVSMAALLAGCTAGLQREQVALPYDCPEKTIDAIVAQQDQLGSLTDTKALACALTVVRNTQDPAVRRTALGSRLCLLLADRETNQEKREKLASEGVEFAEAALALGAERDGAVHYYLAANLGLSVRDHITQAMASLSRLESEMKQAVALSPDIDDGGPLRILGALYTKAPAWPQGIGDPDKARDILEMAVRKHPGHPLNHLFYAQALWAEDDEALLPQVKTEFALAQKLLAEGNWGYSRESWNKEFAEFERELAQAD